MDKKFEVELNKVEKLLEKVDNDLLRQGLRSDFTVFFKNMDKTFEIYNVCLEELCGQLYLMDLAFHSRVVRKLFHNYKHQLHNIMKYQLTLQKELNLKYQQEKQMKNELEKLERDKQKINELLDQEKAKAKTTIDMNFADEDQVKDDKLKELDAQREDILEKANKIKETDDEKKLISDLDDFLSDERWKDGDSHRVKSQLFKILKQYEEQKKRLQELESGILKPQVNGELSEAGKKVKAMKFKGTQTEKRFIEEKEIKEMNKSNTELLKKQEEMEERFKSFDEEKDKLLERVAELEKESKGKDETLDHLNNLVETEQNKIKDLEVEMITAQSEKQQYEILKRHAEDKVEELEPENEEMKEKIKKLERELQELKDRLAEVEENLGGEKEAEAKAKEEIELKKNQLQEDYTKLKENYEKLIKGGDFADESVQKFIEDLQEDLREYKDGKDKYEQLFGTVKEENEGLKRENIDLRDQLDQLEDNMRKTKSHLNKAAYIIKRASEGDPSVFEEEQYEVTDHEGEEENIQNPDGDLQQLNTSRVKTEHIDANDENTIDIESKLKTDQNFNKTNNKSGQTGKEGTVDGEGITGRTGKTGRRKRRIRKTRTRLKLEMLDKEVQAYLDKMQYNDKITFTKGYQTEEVNPISFLIESRDDLLQKPLNYDLIKKAMDVLAALLGYNSLEELIYDKKGSSPQRTGGNTKNTGKRAFKPRIKRPKRGRYQDDDDARKKVRISPKKTKKAKKHDEYFEDFNSDEDDYEEDMYPKLPKHPKRNLKREKHASTSPKIKYDPYYEDFSDLAQSRRIVPKRQQMSMKQQEEEYMRQLSSDEERHGRSISKNRMEKEVALFRMYMNIKKRYFKNPERFLKIFKIYFGREPPKVHMPDPNDPHPDEFLFTYEEFREYYANLVHLHEKCGDECKHLKRFYNRMGIHKKYKGRRYLVLKKQVIDKLPKSKPRRKNSLEKLVRRYYRYY